MKPTKPHTKAGRPPGPPTTQLAVRLTDALLARVDAYTERLCQERPGITVTRADAVRNLLTEALDAKNKSR